LSRLEHLPLHRLRGDRGGGAAGDPVSSLRIDGRERILGRARYVDDLTLPRMAHGKLVRSPHAHARIIAIDLREALSIPGVLGAMTGEELPRKYGPIPVAQDETALAIGKVRYAGEPVVCVVAIDERTASRACEAVRVTWEVLPGVFSAEQALADGAPLVHEGKKGTNVLRRVHQSYGDVDAALAEADLVMEGTYRYPGSTHVALEPHGALARYEDDQLTLWSSTQNPHYLHKEVARVLGLPEARVRVIKPAVGAGYGGKCDPFCSDLCAAHMARKLGRPVKIVMTREEVFYAHRGRHPVSMHLRLAMKRDGTILGLDLSAVAEGGAYASYGVVTAYYLGVFGTMPYRFSSYRFEASRLYTNQPPCGPKRGHGALQPRYAIEAHLDAAAVALGLDPADVRAKNLMGPNEITVNGLEVTSNGIAECLRVVLEASRWERRNELPKGRGLGVAVSSYMCGALHPVYQDEMPQSTVVVMADRSGRVTVLSGTADIGQGSNHMLAEVVAKTLGIDTSAITVVESDTALTPVDLGSYSSRVTFMAGNAAKRAAEVLHNRMVIDLERRFGGHFEQIGAVCRVAGKELSFVDAVRVSEEEGGPLVGVGSYKPRKIGNRFRRQSVGPSPSYSFTAQVAEVSVDADTGVVRVERIWIAHDCGKALNPVLVRGQIQGCVYMGVGEALYEDQAYRDGVLKAPSILEYRIPTVHESPPVEVFLVESNDPDGPFGAKEVGEGPQLSTVPAIANAIRHAIGGLRMDPPFTPDRVLRAMEGGDAPAG
jgi:4-hydroxybenzoyl-CoA reductase subunit alpha